MDPNQGLINFSSNRLTYETERTMTAEKKSPYLNFVSEMEILILMDTSSFISAMINRRTFAATSLKCLHTGQISLCLHTLFCYLTIYKRTEERVAIVCPEHGITRFLFGVEFILDSDNAVTRKMPTLLK